jgi:lysophospholipase L1-like esterase
VLARLDEVTEGKPEKIFLMIGTNDLARGKTVTEVRDKIAEILDTIKKQSTQTTVYLQSVLPTDEQLAPTYRNENIDPLNAELKKLAVLKNVTWVDLVPLFKGENGKLKHELSEDGLHLNGKGYYLWYSAIRKYLW